jgi:hypothetical protein
MDNLSSIQNYRNLIRHLAEADEEDVEPAVTPDDEDEEPAVTPDDEEAGSTDQAIDDREIEDVMTDPKTSETQKISISTLANDLGVSNPDLFKLAFNQLRNGTVPDDPDSQRELSDAFLRVLTADASTTQRVVNRLRAIYRKSAAGATSVG